MSRIVDEIQYHRLMRDLNKLDAWRRRVSQGRTASSQFPADKNSRNVSLGSGDERCVGIATGAADDEEVGLLSGLDRADEGIPSHHLRRNRRHHSDHLLVVK